MSIDEDQIGSIVLGGGNFRPRYPRDDPRHVVTKEESERSKREFILKKLKDFTKVSSLFKNNKRTTRGLSL